MTTDRTFWIVDAGFCVSATGTGIATIKGENGRRIAMGHPPPDRKVWVALLRTLKRLGFSIEDDPSIAANFPSLRATHRAGRRGDLQWHGETYPTGCNIEFFQELVTVNPNGGRYDFDRVAKMNYPIRKSYERAIAALSQCLLDQGFRDVSGIKSANPDPLAYFNNKWDSEWDKKRGIHRFPRDEAGWPSDVEISLWDRRDADGATLHHGDVRLTRDHKGYLRRGRVYGGIGGMWLFVYGPGRTDFTHVSARELFGWRPGLARKQYPNPVARITSRKQAAVKAEQFELAARLRDALRRAAPPEAHAA
jgi:hypothetical protein